MRPLSSPPSLSLSLLKHSWDFSQVSWGLIYEDDLEMMLRAEKMLIWALCVSLRTCCNLLFKPWWTSEVCVCVCVCAHVRVCVCVHACVWTFVDILFYVGPIQTGLNTQQVWCIKISQHLSVWTSDLVSMPFWTVEGRCTDFWVSFISWMSPAWPL